MSRLDAVAVHEYTDRNGEIRKQYTRLGVAFPFRQGTGYTIKLTAMPAPANGEFVIMLMEPRQEGQRQQRQEGASAPSDLNDEVPFGPEMR